MKKMFAILVALSIIFSALVPALSIAAENTQYSQNEITVWVNGERVEFDQQPVIIDGRTLVPIRAIMEALGAQVYWDASSNKVTAVKGSNSISLQIGSDKLYKNSFEIVIDVPAQIINNRTLLPIRAVSEALDCQVDWNGNERKVIIAAEDQPEIDTPPEAISPTIPVPYTYEQDYTGELPSPEPSKEPESTPKPYIIDTVAVGDYGDIMVIKDDYLYYYSERDNAIYEMDVETGKKSKFIDVNDIELPFEQKRSNEVTEEKYKDFYIRELCYDEVHDALLVMGSFHTMTDSYSLTDNTGSFPKLVEITDGVVKEYADDAFDSVDLIMHNGNIFANGYICDYATGSRMTKVDRYIPGFSSDTYGTIYGQMGSELYAVLFFKSGLFSDRSVKSILFRYDFTEGAWHSVQSIDTAICGFKNDLLYCWDTNTGNIFTVNGNGKMSALEMNTNENVDITDMKTIPDSTNFGTIINLNVADNGNIYFYDSNSIRVLRAR